jgi:hypothetical protein
VAFGAPAVESVELHAARQRATARLGMKSFMVCSFG